MIVGIVHGGVIFPQHVGFAGFVIIALAEQTVFKVIGALHFRSAGGYPGDIPVRAVIDLVHEIAAHVIPADERGVAFDVVRQFSFGVVIGFRKQMAVRVPPVFGMVIAVRNRNGLKRRIEIGNAGAVALIIIGHFLTRVAVGGVSGLPVCSQVGHHRLQAVRVKLLYEHGIALGVDDQPARRVIMRFLQHVARRIELPLKAGIADRRGRRGSALFIEICFIKKISVLVVFLFIGSVALGNHHGPAAGVQISDPAIQAGPAVVGQFPGSVSAADQDWLPVRTEIRFV